MRDQFKGRLLEAAIGDVLGMRGRAPFPTSSASRKDTGGRGGGARPKTRGRLWSYMMRCPGGGKKRDGTLLTPEPSFLREHGRRDARTVAEIPGVTEKEELRGWRSHLEKVALEENSKRSCKTPCFGNHGR